MAIINNKDLIQSYVLSTAKYDFSAYEKRILYRLVELCQKALEGQKIDKYFVLQPELFEGLRKVTIPISYFFKDDKDENYSAVKKALKALRNKTFEYETKDTWKLIGLIEMPRFTKDNKDIPKGYAQFHIHEEVFEAILSFSKGFRKFELKTAMAFESVYSMRFYEILSGQKSPITFTIDQLRERFQLQDKYKQNRDFLKRTVERAKKELDEKSPYTFSFKLNKQGRRIHSITLIPKYQPQHRDQELEDKELRKRISPRWELTEVELHYLENQYGFSPDGIKNNMKLFSALKVKGLSLVDEFVEILPKAKLANSPQGYLIGVLKRKLKG